MATKGKILPGIRGLRPKNTANAWSLVAPKAVLGHNAQQKGAPRPQKALGRLWHRALDTILARLAVKNVDSDPKALTKVEAHRS